MSDLANFLAVNTVNSSMHLILTKFLQVFNFAKNQEPYFACIKFRDFEKKVELECIKAKHNSLNQT